MLLRKTTETLVVSRLDVALRPDGGAIVVWYEVDTDRDGWLPTRLWMGELPRDGTCLVGVQRLADGADDLAVCDFGVFLGVRGDGVVLWQGRSSSAGRFDQGTTEELIALRLLGDGQRLPRETVAVIEGDDSFTRGLEAVVDHRGNITVTYSAGHGRLPQHLCAVRFE